MTWKERGSRWGKAGVCVCGGGVSNRERREEGRERREGGKEGKREGDPYRSTGSETEEGIRQRNRASSGTRIGLGQEAERTHGQQWGLAAQ